MARLSSPLRCSPVEDLKNPYAPRQSNVENSRPLAVAYARAIGAEPLIQVPLLADIDGSPPTAASAAAMVTYANVTMHLSHLA